MNNPAMVSLVGAGPGDPELLTLKAVKRLQEADSIVYDRLVSKEVLEHASPGTELVYVGKRKHLHVRSQDEINTLLVERSKTGRRTVRLKGGDPFIFGRGGEEIHCLEAHGCPWEVVPGISAINGAAADFGLPLTLRGECQALTLVTAHRESGELCLDWDLLLHQGQTVAIYMGLSVIPRLAATLISRGKNPDTPASVVANASLPRAESVLTQLSKLIDPAMTAHLPSPAILILGPRPAAALPHTKMDASLPDHTNSDLGASIR